MPLTITTTARDATDLGHLAHKHPDRLHERDVGFGAARVFSPEAGPDCCTMAMAVEGDAAFMSPIAGHFEPRVPVPTGPIDKW